MGKVIHDSRLHARASSVLRAARAMRVSALSWDSDAATVANIGDHHSAGTLSRCHHFDTADGLAPISEAIASREGQSSIKSRKVSICVAMPDVIGPFVLKRKADLSLDAKLSLGHTVQMSESDAKAQYEQEFIERVKAARIATGKKQWQVAELMGIKQDTYKHFETGRVIPHHQIGRFCLICNIDPNWLLTGKGAKPMQPPHVVETEAVPVAKPKKAKRSTRAA